MTVRTPLVVVSGQTQQLQSGDSISGGGSSVLWWGAETISKDTAVRYMRPGWTEAVLSQTDDYAVVIPIAGTLKNLYVRHGVALGNGNNVVYAVVKNGSVQAITATLASGAIGGASDTSNTVAVAAGDRVSIKITKAVQIGNALQSATVSLLLAS